MAKFVDISLPTENFNLWLNLDTVQTIKITGGDGLIEFISPELGTWTIPNEQSAILEKALLGGV